MTNTDCGPAIGLHEAGSSKMAIGDILIQNV